MHKCKKMNGMLTKIVENNNPILMKIVNTLEFYLGQKKIGAI